MNQRAYRTGAALHNGTLAAGSAIGSFFKHIGAGVRDFAKGMKNGKPTAARIVQRNTKRARKAR